MWCAWASGNRPWGEFWGIVNDGATFIKHNALPDFEDALEERWEHVPLDEQ
jgi:hypothetical protein